MEFLKVIGIIVVGIFMVGGVLFAFGAVVFYMRGLHKAETEVKYICSQCQTVIEDSEECYVIELVNKEESIDYDK